MDRQDTPVFPVEGVYRIEVSAKLAGDGDTLATAQFTQFMADDLPYIEEIPMRWPLIFEVVSDEEELEPGRSYLRRW